MLAIAIFLLGSEFDLSDVAPLAFVCLRVIARIVVCGHVYEGVVSCIDGTIPACDQSRPHMWRH